MMPFGHSIPPEHEEEKNFQKKKVRNKIKRNRLRPHIEELETGTIDDSWEIAGQVTDDKKCKKRKNKLK